MQLKRLFEIVYILLSRQQVTAKELANEFEVSVRTIYRDIDALSAAGVPVYAQQGKGGGICLMKEFVFNKSLLSAEEQRDILLSLQGLMMLQGESNEALLRKISGLFQHQPIQWLEVDFSCWGKAAGERETFAVLKEAILQKQGLTFRYYNSNGESSLRSVEPLKLVFKSRAWYLYAYCQKRQENRLFKIVRMKEVRSTGVSFVREAPPGAGWEEAAAAVEPYRIELVLRVDAGMAYRLYDEMDIACIARQADGDFIVTLDFPENEWIYGYILSYGAAAEVLTPVHIREGVKQRLQQIQRRYRES